MSIITGRTKRKKKSTKVRHQLDCSALGSLDQKDPFALIFAALSLCYTVLHSWFLCRHGTLRPPKKKQQQQKRQQPQ